MGQFQLLGRLCWVEFEYFVMEANPIKSSGAAVFSCIVTHLMNSPPKEKPRENCTQKQLHEADTENTTFFRWQPHIISKQQFTKSIRRCVLCVASFETRLARLPRLNFPRLLLFLAFRWTFLQHFSLLPRPLSHRQEPSILIFHSFDASHLHDTFDSLRLPHNFLPIKEWSGKLATVTHTHASKQGGNLFSAAMIKEWLHDKTWMELSSGW